VPRTQIKVVSQQFGNNGLKYLRNGWCCWRSFATGCTTGLKAAASDNCLTEHFTPIFVIGAYKK